MPDRDQKYYDEVAEELTKNELRPGLWTRAMAEAGDDGPRAKAAYIRLRFTELKQELEPHAKDEETPIRHRVRLGAPSMHEVGGWLLIFCIILTVIGPAISFSRMAVQYDELMRQYSDAGLEYNVFATRSGIDYIFITGIVIYGIVAGIIIWKGSKNGRKIAKDYIAIRFILMIFYVLMSPISNVMEIIDIARVFIPEVVFFSVWMTYFHKSQRVKLTYGENDT